MNNKNRKKLRNCKFRSTGCSLLREEASPIVWTSFMEAYHLRISNLQLEFKEFLVIKTLDPEPVPDPH
jgi:hypothetical protein